jgi:hypothetical protein
MGRVLRLVGRSTVQRLLLLRLLLRSGEVDCGVAAGLVPCSPGSKEQQVLGESVCVCECV